jgi:hypothetical protein
VPDQSHYQMPSGAPPPPGRRVKGAVV